MNITIFAGKGGVGKSTCASAHALHLAKENPTILVDYDGGHSVPTLLGLDESHITSNEMFESEIDDLYLAVIDQFPFTTIIEAREEPGYTFEKYFDQFQEDYAFLGFCDMVTRFFGVPTDISSMSRFLTFCNIYSKLNGVVENLVLDVEPTAGLERLMQSTDQIAESMDNMKNYGFWRLKLLGTQWPDIVKFLETDYIREEADMYAARLKHIAKVLQDARYFVVCNPEPGPVGQMEKIKKIITSYDANIEGYIINNLRGARQEKQQIEIVKEKAGSLDILEIPYNPDLCDTDKCAKIEGLQEIGECLEETFPTPESGASFLYTY